MRQKLSNGLHWLADLFVSLTFTGIFVVPFWRGYPLKPFENYLDSAIFLLSSLLLFFLIWCFPRLKRWETQMMGLVLAGSCLASSYTGWVYAPRWGFAPLWGHVVGFLVGMVLGFGIFLWEGQTIAARRRSLLAERRGALDV